MNSAENTICHFFVYGTLCRGQCLANLWPAEPREIVSAWVFGELFGREDYPAMRPGGDRIAGECWQFEPSDIPEVVRALDIIEETNQPGAANLYDRVTLEVFEIESGAVSQGTQAYAYHFATDPLQSGFERIDPSGDGWCRWPTASPAK